MSVTMREMTNMSRWLGLVVAAGLAVGALLFGLVIVAMESTRRPAHREQETHAEMTQLAPLVEDGWIKVPLDIDRTEECIAQSTFSLTRKHVYPPPWGEREDDVRIGLYNSPVSGIGAHHMMLWFKHQDIAPGAWMISVNAGSDCGNWLLHPGMRDSGPIPLGTITVPPA